MHDIVHHNTATCKDCRQKFGSMATFIAHRVCKTQAEAAIAARDSVIRELVAANIRARQPGHVSDVIQAIEQRYKIEAKALALIGGEKGEQP